MKIGIVADNYKLKRFEKELADKGFNITTKPFTNGTTSIFIETDEAGKNKIDKICKEVELYFKRSN